MRNREMRGQRGFTLLEFLMVTVVLVVLVSIALPNYVESRKTANETSAVESMQALVAAEENYRVAQTTPRYGWLAQLKADGFISDVLGTGSKSGYTFIPFGTPEKDTYAFIGKPDVNAGDLWYYVDQTGVIRVKEGGPPDESSPVLR